MNIHVFLKVFAEISLFFGCISALPALFSFDFLFLWPAIVCASAAGMGAFLSDQGKPSAKIPLILLAATALSFGRSLLEWMILIPPVLYTVPMILRDECSLEYFQFREQFRKTLTIMGIALILVHFGVLIESRSHHTRVLDSVAFLRYLLLYGICGIVLQLQLRIGTEQKRSHYLSNLQILLVSVCTTILVLAIILAERFLSSQGLSLGQMAGRALQILFGSFLSLFQYLFVKVSEMIKTAQRLRNEDLNNADIDPTPVMPMEEMQQLLPQTPPEEAVFPWWLPILILAVFTALLVLLTRVLRSRNAEVHHAEVITQIQPKAKEKKLPSRSNRSRLRKIYREFLKAEKRRGHKLQHWHTSEQILDELSDAKNPKSAAQLRSLYLSARYDLENQVTPQQVQSARDALKAYKSE